MITIPAPLSEGLTFRWFLEYVVDNSPLFKTASSIAKASPLLAADLDTVGSELSPPEPTLKLFRDALNNDEQPLELPLLTTKVADADGNEVDRQVPMRIYSRFIDIFSRPE